MHPGVSLLRRDLVLWMADLRRLAVLVGFGGALVQRLTGSAGPAMDAVVLVVLGVFAANEIGRHLVDDAPDARVITVANAQVTFDTLALLTLLHVGGGFGSAGVLFLPVPFFVYGAVLPLGHVMAHLGEALLGLSLLGLAERGGVLAHQVGGMFLLPGAAGGGDLVAVTIVLVVMVSALGAVTSHVLSSMLRARAADGRVLAAERGTLIAGYEREAGRVRLLLDVAERVSASQSVHELMSSVCTTTMACGHIARVETFVWDEDQSCLRLVVASGGAGRGVDERELRYAGDLPIVTRLRAGEVVDFDAVPSLAMASIPVPRRVQRAFAVPMLCRGTFEGALVVGYDGGSDPGDLVDMAQGIACQAAVALANARALEQQREDAEVSSVLLELSRAFSACHDTDELWRLITRSASEVLELPWAVAAGFDERERAFSLVAAQGLPDPAVEAFRDARIRPEDSPVLQTLLARGEILVADESHVRDVVAAAGWQVGAWLVIPLFRGGWVVGLVATGYVSKRRTFRRRQIRLAEGLAHHAAIALQNARLVADLEAADRLKSEFVSTMSHELRTPLNVIIGYTEMLRDGAVGELAAEQRDLIERLDARGRELLELIEATLHVGRLEAGRDAVEIGPVELGDLVRALQASTSGLPCPPDVTLVWDVPAKTGGVVMTDRAKLALVIRNLVSNALRFTSHGTVTVQLQVRAAALAIEVRDTGIGIAPEHLPVIFDMFRQVGGSSAHRHGGVGLGLYIVRQFMTRLGGAVEVTSTPGRGSRFTVVLPDAVQGRRWAA